MFSHVYRYFEKHTGISIFLLVFCFCLFLFFSQDSFKLGTTVAFAFILVIYLLTKNFFLSLLIVFLTSSQFFFPGKTYQFEYAAASEYIYELLPNGLFEFIVVNISDLCGIFLTLLLFREKINSLTQVHTKHNVRLDAIIKSPLVASVLIAWFIYFSISLYSSIYLSFLPIFSVNILAQYGKMVVMFLGVVYILWKEKKLSHFFYITLLSMLLFQSILGSIQFAKSLTSYGTEKLPTIDVEQNVDFSRVEGISGHPNNHAFAIAILLVITAPFVLAKKKKTLVGHYALRTGKYHLFSKQNYLDGSCNNCTAFLCFPRFRYQKGYQSFLQK